MHSVLLLHRSLVLAAVTAGYDSGGSGSDSVGGGGVDVGVSVSGGVAEGFGETDIKNRVPKTVHKHSSHDANAVGKGGKKVSNTKFSSSEDVQWAAAQAAADAAVVAAAEKEKAAIATFHHDAGGISERGEGFLVKPDGSSTDRVKPLTPEQLQSARDIAGQLNTEVLEKIRLLSINRSSFFTVTFGIVSSAPVSSKVLFCD